MIFKKITSVILFSFFLPVAVFAFSEREYNAFFLSNDTINIIEIASLLLSLIASSYAIKLATLARGGQMEKTWNILALASIIFALNEAVNNFLRSFGINAYGYDKLFELLLALILLIAFINTKNMFLKQMKRE